MKLCAPIKTSLSNSLALAMAILLTTTFSTNAQNLVVTGDFAGGSYSGWSTTSSIEVNPESTYGGPSSSIYVTELDVERNLNQDICIMPGASYMFTFSAARRPNSATPANPGVLVIVKGTSSNTNYIGYNFQLTSTTWTQSNYSFTVTIPATSPDRKINISFAPTNNTTTYGILVWNIQLGLAPAYAMSIAGPASRGTNQTANFALVNSTASTIYNWSFGSGASIATSTDAQPALSWSTTGTKTVSLAVSNGTCTMYTYTTTVKINTTLPVQLSGFTGEVAGGSAQLTWITEKETNSRDFVIERSANGADYDSIGVVASLNAATAYTYHYTDATMPAGVNYYRLRHEDKDGAVIYSQVITLNNAATGNTGKLSVFPNPAASTLNYAINSDKASHIAIQVFNPSGVMVMNSQAQLAAGPNQQTLSIAQLGHGSYFLKVIDEQGSFHYTQPFVKL